MRNRFLRRLAAPSNAAERLRIERVLALARIFLTISAMGAVFVDATEPRRYVEVAYSILAAYCLWSAIAWLIVHRARTIDKLPVWIHLLDIAFPMAFMLFTEGPNSPFFVFLLFVLTAAAFRWGLPEAVLTCLGVAALIILEAIVLSYGRQGWIVGQYQMNRFVIRLSYLIALGILIGFMGEEEKQWRAENSTVSRLLTRINGSSGLGEAMQEFLTEMLRVFRGARALVVLAEAGTGRMYVWRQSGAEPYVQSSEVEPASRKAYEFTLPADSLFAAKTGARWKCWGVDSDGCRMNAPLSYDPVRSFPEMNGARSLLAAALHIGEEWSGSVLLFDAVTGPATLTELRFVQTVVQQITPALYTVYLIRRLRSRAGAIERARVARELHDGAIQAMISVEMQLDVLRRQLEVPAKSGAVAGGLARVQVIVRDQIFELRSLMHHLKPVEFRAGQFLDFLADAVDRFRRDTGIAAQFVTTLDEVQMPARVGRELVRIVQEALVNIRKHSGATRASVRFAAEDGCWRLGIVDNGRGFDFCGRMSLEELDASHRGPGIIKERVRSLGGDMTLQSKPGSGTELSITVRQKAQTTHV